MEAIKMKASDLTKVWTMPDNTRLTAKQYSFRLPVHVAAKISALCDMYPKKNRTEIIGDLLTAAINAVEESFPSVKGSHVHDDETGTYYEDVGPSKQYRKLSNRYYKELEKELGNENPANLFSGFPLSNPEFVKRDSKVWK